MGIDKNIRVDNEIANRDLVDFDFNNHNDYSAMCNAAINDFINRQKDYKFEINDIQLSVPPLFIGINKESLDYSYKTLRSKSNTKLQSSNAIFHVSLTLLFPRETLLQLHRLIIQIRNNPFVYINNKYLASSVGFDDFFNSIVNKTNAPKENASSHFSVFNIQVSNYQQSPGCFLVELDLRYFNHNPFSSTLLFKKELLYQNLVFPKHSSISVYPKIEKFGDGSSSITFDHYKFVGPDLRFSDTFSFDQSGFYVNKNRPTRNITDDYLYSRFVSEKITTFPVERAVDSNIFVRFYNKLQAKALYDNFEIDVRDTLLTFGYDDIVDWFEMGVEQNSTLHPAFVFSFASKYFPTQIRNEIIEKMLSEDSTIRIYYDTYHKLSLSSEYLKMLSDKLKKGVQFNRDPDNLSLIKQNNSALKKNENELKTQLENFASGNKEGLSDIEIDFYEKLLNYIKLNHSNNINYTNLSFMMISEDLYNVYSYTENELITIDYQEEKFNSQMKSLVVTSMSAMISNQIATIPLLGHHYPTHQYIGSTEPKYSMTFIGQTLPDSRDDLSIGIKKIENIKNVLAFNSNAFKFIPNSNCFALDSFITRLFDTTKIIEIPKEGKLSNLKKRLSINALNTQTIESLPGMSSGTLRLSETNSFDYEKISQVYSSELSNIPELVKKVDNSLRNKTKTLPLKHTVNNINNPIFSIPSDDGGTLGINRYNVLDMGQAKNEDIEAKRVESRETFTKEISAIKDAFFNAYNLENTIKQNSDDPINDIITSKQSNNSLIKDIVDKLNSVYTENTELRNLVGKYLLLDETLKYSLYPPVINEERKNLTLEQIYPDLSFSTIKDLKISDFREGDNLLNDFLIYLFGSTNIEKRFFATDHYNETKIAESGLNVLAVAVLVSAPLTLSLIAAASLIALGMAIDSDTTSSPKYSNFIGVKNYLATHFNKTYNTNDSSIVKINEVLKDFGLIKSNQLVDLLTEEKTEISKANDEYKDILSDILEELNNKNRSNSSLENVFPNIIKGFFETNKALRLYPNIQKTFIANAAAQGLLLPNNFGPDEFLGGFFYSVLTQLFWYPSEYDPIINDDDYTSLFSQNLDGIVVNSDSFEKFDLVKDSEQRYLKNILYQTDDYVLFRQRLKDTDNISTALKLIWPKDPPESDGNLINFLLSNSDKTIEKKIDDLNKNIIRAFRIEKENILIKLANSQQFIDYLQLIDPETYKNIKIVSEIDGIDLSKESCYPDIDLPRVPVINNSNLYLNPGFFYFDENSDLINEYEKDNRRTNDIKYATNIFKKTKDFMTKMKTDGFYSGTENKASLEKRSQDGTLAISFDELLYDMRDETLSEKVKIVSKPEDSATEKINIKWDYDSGDLTYSIDGNDTTINIMQLHGTVGYDYLNKYAEEVIKSKSFLEIEDPDERAKKLDEILNAKKEELISVINKSSPGQKIYGDKTNKTDLTAFTSQTIINQTNRTGNIAKDAKQIAEDALKLFKGDDQYGSDEKIVEDLGIQSFDDTRSINQAYPTFKFYLVEEDVVDSSNFNVYDDFYSYNGVKDITIYKSRKLAADTAIIRLQNISGSIDGSKTNVYRDVDYEMGVVSIETMEEGNRSNNLGIQSIMLRPGVTAQIRMGYNSNPNELQVMLSGKVTDVNWSSSGDLCEIVVQSFGVELLAKRLGTSADVETSEIPFKDTQTLLGFIIHQSELLHFGRFKVGSQSLEGENKDLMIRLDYSLDEMLFNNVTNGIMATINNLTIGIAVAGVIASSVAYFTRSSQVTRRVLEAIRAYGAIGFKGLRNTLNLLPDPVPANNLVQAANIFVRSAVRLKDAGRAVLNFLTPIWVGVFSGLAGANGLLRSTTGVVRITRSEAFNRFGLLGTLIRLGNNANSLGNIGAMQFIFHGLIMPGFRTASTIMIFNTLVVGIAGGSIESMVRYIAWSWNNLIGYDLSKKYFKDKYKSLMIRKSPADDCIYIPDRELYINTDEEAELKEPFLVNISNYLNQVKGNFLDSNMLGNFLNSLIGTTSWKFTLQKENTVMTKEDIDELSKQTFLLSDKRLSIKDYSSYYYIKGYTAWEVLNEMTLRHTGWITGARPYGLGLEYRLFFGKPNDNFFYKEFSQSTIKLLNETINYLYTKNASDPNRVLFTQKSTINDPSAKLINLIPNNIRNAYRQITFNEPDSTINDSDLKYKALLKDYLIRNLYGKISKRKRPFRQYHLLSSRFNLVSNNIQVTEKAHNAVNVKFRYKLDNANKDEMIFTRQLKLHDNIPDEKLNVADIDFPECKGFAGALRYGVSTLLLETKEMYDGEIICIGKPTINPHDVCIIEDTYNNIYGGIEVEAVTHLFSAETGYLTEIRPNMICTSNESTTYPILQTQAIFEASKRVVEEIKLTKTELKDPTKLKKEITDVVDKYFNSNIGERVLDELRGKDNFANNNNLPSLLSQDTQATISILKEIIIELIKQGYENNDLDFVNNMSSGIAQLPENIKTMLYKLSTDIGILSAIFYTISIGLSKFIKINPDQMTSFQSTISSLLTKSGDLSLYALVASASTAVFGENVIESYMGHQSTMYKVADSLNQTNFAKINDGTLIQMWPLFKNNRPLVANGVEYIKQNYIWHHRFGEIYNTISDAAFGYLNEKERIQSYSKMWEKDDDVNFTGQPVLYLKYLISSRYNPLNFTTKELYAYDQLTSSGLERK